MKVKDLLEKLKLLDPEGEVSILSSIEIYETSEWTKNKLQKDALPPPKNIIFFPSVK